MNRKIIIVSLFAIISSSFYIINNYKNFDLDDLKVIPLEPLPERDEKYIKYLSAGVKIASLTKHNTFFAYGSGTIIHYDKKTNTAYIASCGHLWEGDLYSTDKPKICFINVFYHNNIKVNKIYVAKVIFHVNRPGYDVSLIKFNPDWEIKNYFPIAPIDYNYKNYFYNSIGCDEGTEVARYETIITKINNKCLTTRKNNPRKGRSGGGLISDEGILVGICWGTNDYRGYYTTLYGIHTVFEINGYGWLLK